MATATFIMRDHNFGRDSITHWYDLNGIDKDTGIVFNNSRYGIEYYSRGGFKAFVDSKREELPDGDNTTKAVINTFKEGKLI